MWSSMGYTLVESLVAIGLFVTVVLWALGTMNSFMISPRTKVLYSALMTAEDKLAIVTPDNLIASRSTDGKLVIEQTVIVGDGYWGVTFAIYNAKDGERPVMKITKLFLLSHAK